MVLPALGIVQEQAWSVMALLCKFKLVWFYFPGLMQILYGKVCCAKRCAFKPYFCRNSLLLIVSFLVESDYFLFPRLILGSYT